MARNLEFEPDKALEKAMLLFWKKGASGTSVEDLVQATKVQRSGLYNVFGGKNNLLKKSLELYISQVIDVNTRALRQQNADLGAIRSFFEQFLHLLDHPMAKYGCLMCFSAMEIAKIDRGAAKIVNSSISKIESYFVDALTNAQLRNCRSETQILEQAHFFLGSVFAINSLLRAGVSEGVVKNYITGVLKIVDNLS
ncbi:MAG: hypothetical protein COT74_00745 [Bdellovibrionales bacterium CG10_big_fil_rev_8_21_14_0_10_45_34]|nr:MAG: hypothetical protein COT74_00745 [Bdellovibrionales bacterium CG10_big_fil_rev_8_21_14_0_10_45_34]